MTRSVIHLDEIGLFQRGQERWEVFLAPRPVDLVLADDHVAEVAYATWLLKQCPDTGADAVETVVETGAEVEDGDLVTEVAPDLASGGTKDGFRAEW